MKFFFWGLGVFVTLLPVIVPVMIRGKGPSALFLLRNYVPNYRDILFLIVAINAISLVEIAQALFEHKHLEIGYEWLIVILSVPICCEGYALIQVGRYAEKDERLIMAIEPTSLKGDWAIVFFSTTCALALKAIVD